MDKILVITSILPIAELEHKKNENDILLVTENQLMSRDKSLKFEYLFFFPKANIVLAQFSRKWKAYFKLGQNETSLTQGKIIQLLPVLLLPKKVFFRNLLIQISLFRKRKVIKGIMETFQPTIIHAQCADTSAFIAKKISEKYKIPYVVTLRGINQFTDKKTVENIEAAANIVAISPKQLIDAKELTNKKVHFIPHGIHDSFFQYTQRLRSENEKLRLITVSRLIALKNIDKVIKSLQNFKKDFVFDIFGEGPEKEALQKLIFDLGMEGKVNLKGKILNEKLPTLFNSYDLFVMPSYPETLGRVYFEAMGCGLPVIATKGTGIDGLISNGVQGFLVDVHDEKLFSESFNSILQQLYNNQQLQTEMSKAAHEFARTFSWDEIVPKYLALYKNE
ncbi:glycosyltransferase [Flavobacterium chuncheonense]|uniref:Glycosyltransferase n=1 Tax=Flavobacterium chuncheonense TaxID=2026653 RepID=A0ABW5YKJ6_9FLAO